MMIDPQSGKVRPTWPRLSGRLRQALLWPVAGVCLLWILELLQALGGFRLMTLGVYPRSIDGLAGIVTAPLIHDSWNHLLANTPALLGLGILSLYGYPRATRRAVPIIWLLSGIGVWIFARSSFHIGISGLTHGLMFFLLAMGVVRRDRLSIALALIVVLLFGGMASGVVPSDPGVSFEYHLIGALAGILAAIMLFRLDPLPIRPPPPRDDEWEENDDGQDASDRNAAGNEPATPLQTPANGERDSDGEPRERA